MEEGLETGPSVPADSLDIEKLSLEAQNRWLRPTEICHILWNYEKFGIASEPPNEPPSGSLYLFDRRVVRNFRKDGHNWRRKENGKLAKEGHKKLKIGSIEVLHCYYAHGEENENFQRCCYSMTEKDFSDIVLVHYLKETVKKTKGANPYSQETENLMPNSEIDRSMSSGSRPNNCPELSENTDTCLNSAQTLERENARSAIPGIDLAPTQSDKGKSDNDAESTDAWMIYFNFDLWNSESSTPRGESSHQSYSTSCGRENTVASLISLGAVPGALTEPSPKCPLGRTPADLASANGHKGIVEYLGNRPLGVPISFINLDNQDDVGRGRKAVQNISEISTTAPSLGNTSDGRSREYPRIYDADSDPTQLDMGNSDVDAMLAELIDRRTSFDLSILEDKWENFTPCGHGSLSSFSRPDTVGKRVSNKFVKRLEIEGHLQIQEKSKASVEDSSSLSTRPIDQKLNSESAYYATSKFHEQVNHLELMDSVDPQQKRPDLRNNNSKETHFQRLQHLFDGLLTEQGSKKRSSSGDSGETGENENENDVLSIPSEGKLDIQDINAAENYSDSVEADLLLRFDKILRSGSSANNSVTSSSEDASQLSSKISSLQKGDNKELDQMLKTGSGTEFSLQKVTDQLLQMHLKEKLHVWISQKVAEGGDGPSILDEGGQGVLHLAAALGYDWALKPTIDAGVSVDFHDVNDWTALHWAAFCGRENTVASLISWGAAPGALTEPSPKYPLGRTPADLASANGHKGVAVYLGKRPISSNNLDSQDDVGRGPKAVQNISEISAVPLSLGNASDCQSRKDLLATNTSSFTISEIPPDLSEGAMNLATLHLVALHSEGLNRWFAPTRLELDRLIERVHEDMNYLNAARRSEGAMNLAILHLVALPRSEAHTPSFNLDHDDAADMSRLIAHLQEIKRLWRRIDRLHWRDVRPEDRGLEKEKEKEERKKRAPDPDLESGKAHKILKGPEDDEGPEKEKEEGKKQAPDLALESGKAYKILKAHLAYKALLTTYYNVQSMMTIQMLVLAFVEAFKKIGERKLSHIDGRLELSAIRI